MVHTTDAIILTSHFVTLITWTPVHTYAPTVNLRNHIQQPASSSSPSN